MKMHPNHAFQALIESCKDSDRLLQVLNIDGMHEAAKELIGYLYKKSLAERSVFGATFILEIRKDLFLTHYNSDCRLTAAEMSDAKKMVETINLASLAYHIIYGLKYGILIGHFFQTLDNDRFATDLVKCYFKLRYLTLSTSKKSLSNSSSAAAATTSLTGGFNFDNLPVNLYPFIADKYRQDFEITEATATEHVFYYEMIQFIQEIYRYIQSERVRQHPKLFKYVTHHYHY